MFLVHNCSTQYLYEFGLAIRKRKDNKMVQLKSTVEILKLLDKSNCRKCNESTCLAFAALVFKGQKQLDECPNLSNEIIEQYEGKVEKRASFEQEAEEGIEVLKNMITGIDLLATAKKLNADFSDGRLAIKILGKNLSVDSKGNITTDIHVHPWLMGPVFNYILEGGRAAVTGDWVPLRELAGGKEWLGLFGQRCEMPFKKVADTYTALFEDMIHVFNGKQVENHYNSDISLVLYPLPRVPILICYWKPEDGLESDLNLFFDSTADKNLDIKFLYGLVAGLVMMFEKIALRHGF